MGFPRAPDPLPTLSPKESTQDQTGSRLRAGVCCAPLPLAPPMATTFLALHDRLRQDGYAFVAADGMRELLDAASLPDWAAFTASWDALDRKSVV